MLKYYIYLTLLLFAGFQVEAYTEQEEGEIIENYIKNKCLKNGGENALDDLQKSVEDAWRCVAVEFEDITPLRTPKDEEDLLRIVCTELQPTLHSCFNIILEKVDHCLDKEEKYFPSFMSEWFNHTFATHCEGDKEVFKEHHEFLKKTECKDVDQDIINSIPEKCFEKSTIVEDFKSPDFIITKAGLCGYLEHGNQCFVDILKENCGEALAKYAEDHLKPTKIWCDKYVDGEN